MSGDHVDDQIAALAFGALTEEERAQVAGHLLVCPACAGRYDDAQSLVALLPFVAAPQRAPMEIKEELFKRLQTDVVPLQAGPSVNGAHSAAPPARTAAPPEWARRAPAPRWQTVLLHTVPWTVAIIAAIFASVMLVYSHGQSDRVRAEQQDQQRQAADFQKQSDATAAQLAGLQLVKSYLSTPDLRVLPLKYLAGIARHTNVALVMSPAYAHALLVARGLAMLPSPKDYVVWARTATGGFARLGSLITAGPRADGVALLAAPHALGRYTMVGISVEITPGLERPTTPMIFTATIADTST